MFDISAVSKRYFNIKLNIMDDNGKAHSLQLEVEPPKVKVLKKLFSTFKRASTATVNKDGTDNPEEAEIDADIFDDLYEAVLKILNKNKAHKKVPEKYIDDLDLDQLLEIVTAYFGWLGEAKEKNPN